jgi:hypothetical protein
MSLGIEADGHAWHTGRDKAERDNDRENDIKPLGWQILRFSSTKIEQELESHCLKKINQMIVRLGGLDDGRFVSRQLNTDPSVPEQLSLFDDNPIDKDIS